MRIASTDELNSTESVSPGRERRLPWSVFAWSGLLFALLQSVCTFLAAAQGVRLIIGLGSLVMGASSDSLIDRLHVDWLRIPMIALATLGSLLNLVVIAQVRRLRARPASQWRIQPVSARRLTMERLQLLLALATLILAGAEEFFHHRYFHHL